MEAQHFQHVVCHLSCKFCCSFASESDLLQLHFAHDFLERVTLKQIRHYIQLRSVLLPCFLPVKCLRHPSLNLYESMSHSCIYYEPSYCGTQFSFIFKTPGNYFLSYRIKQQNFLTKVVSFSFVRSSSLVRQLSLACRKRKKIASYSLPILAVNCTIKLIFVIDQVRERSGKSQVAKLGASFPLRQPIKTQYLRQLPLQGCRLYCQSKPAASKYLDNLYSTQSPWIEPWTSTVCVAVTKLLSNCMYSGSFVSMARKKQFNDCELLSWESR